MAFVSGSVLLWGALLLKLWPVAAHFQTGRHLRAIVTESAMPDAKYYSFKLLLLLVTVGAGMLVCGVVHLVARGMWLTRFSSRQFARNTMLAHRIADNAYITLYLYWWSAGVLIVFMLMAMTLYFAAAAIANTLRLSVSISLDVVFYSAFGIALLVAARFAALWLDKLGRDGYTRWLRTKGGHIVVAAAMFTVIDAAANEFCNVSNVGLSAVVVSRRADRPLVVKVTLGGSLSDPTPARVTLLGRDGSCAPLALQHLESGVYYHLLNPRELSQGRYEISLSYPHWQLSTTAPWIRTFIDKRTAFVVTE